MKCYRDHCHCRCHCLNFEIDDRLRSKCRSAWEKCRNVQREGSEFNSKDTEIFKERLKTTLKNEEDRIAKFRQSLAARSTFLSPSLMKNVYKKPEKNEDGAK